VTEPPDEFVAVFNRLRDEQHAMETRERNIVSRYESAGRSRIKRAALVEYLCRDARGCLLLHCWQAPDGRFLYQPPFHFSPERNLAESTAIARTTRTLDGDRHWPSHGWNLDDLDGQLKLQCDYVHLVWNVSDVLADADDSTAGHPTRRHLKSR